MQLAFIGLGKMGLPMSMNAVRAGHDIYGFDLDRAVCATAKKQGVKIAPNLQELIKQLSAPRVIWLMLPNGKAVEEAIFGKGGLITILKKEDTIIDGGNSNWRVSANRAQRVNEVGLRWLDMGVSGGTVAAERGYAMMAGGDRTAFRQVEPLIKDLTQVGGYGYFGNAGAGHFIKMVHNSIEYGMMEAIAEGFNLLKNGPVGKIDAEKVARVWNHGTIVESFLMEMAQQALVKDANLNNLKGYVEDTGEGKWAVEEAVNHAIPYTVNTEAVYARFSSRDNGDFANKLLAAMRNKFGGHAFRKK
ncbi:MAG: 6-phosphogluconate dehydrogenase (decarboxylating) [Candidatus Spechtbacteria bacterium RIFCSPLOWO2_01_FULL_46_10]|uniref:6-phosphogluconate dehydrogenase (Decarboxylating) n=1 Tax=Candidatus Spechtbacteria bacterium RIFCSPLOWO2_01_FULL_46_10 TaxID=1802163 RepID=A0A1G2HH69_9BACT|nr:MAG: 6-phosphogluconate dehydrogenase (decarboxylating) [Candidatus Spechtbacteria bacterium RIFCSPLOWO2_01_FULL_46_10]